MPGTAEVKQKNGQFAKVAKKIRIKLFFFNVRYDNIILHTEAEGRKILAHQI